MKKAFILSCFIATTLLFGGLITGNYELYRNILVGIGIISLLISALLSGVFLSGPEIQANYHTESKDDRKKRTKMMFITGIFSLPHLVGAAFFILL